MFYNINFHFHIKRDPTVCRVSDLFIVIFALLICLRSLQRREGFYPRIASRRAPPPVDTYETLSARPNLLTHATESPPPTREKAPSLVASTIASAMAFDPVVKLSNSNTPAGPSQDGFCWYDHLSECFELTRDLHQDLPSLPGYSARSRSECWHRC